MKDRGRDLSQAADIVRGLPPGAPEGAAPHLRIDGKPRQPHGKGYRALLHAAFAFGLLNYCQRHGTPHPGFLVIDSPLTLFKKTEKRTAGEEIDPGVERAFWKSPVATGSATRIIVLENKEPPSTVTPDLNYIHFAGKNAAPGQRIGFNPPNSPAGYASSE